MAPRLSGQTPIFGASFIVTKCPLGIRDEKLRTSTFRNRPLQDPLIWYKNQLGWDEWVTQWVTSARLSFV